MPLIAYRSASEAIADACQKMQVVSVTLAWAGGTYHCHVTPSEVVGVPAISLPSKSWARPRWEFRIDPRKNASELVPATIAAYGVNTNGIWFGGPRFPDCCVACMGAVAYVQLIEAGVLTVLFPKTSWPGEFLRPKQTGNLKRAIQRVRYWYAVPFCSEHSIDDAAVTITESLVPPDKDNIDWQIKLEFEHKEYGAAFGELNGTRGVWATGSRLLARYVGILSLIGGLALSLVYKLLWGMPVALIGFLAAAWSYSPYTIRELFSGLGPALVGPKPLKCHGCNRPDVIKMEDGRLWCSWCGDWAK